LDLARAQSYERHKEANLTNIHLQHASAGDIELTIWRKSSNLRRAPRLYPKERKQMQRSPAYIRQQFGLRIVVVVGMALAFIGAPAAHAATVVVTPRPTA
jgi:hypothetical protein